MKTPNPSVTTFMLCAMLLSAYSAVLGKKFREKRRARVVMTRDPFALVLTRDFTAYKHGDSPSHCVTVQLAVTN